MFAPLQGVRVIDLTHVLAGPYCTHQLAMLGAEVIKVEPPGVGDLTRFGGPIQELNDEKLGLAFCTQNSDKASITINLKAPEGIDVVRRLVAGADIFVENFRPGVSERLGLGYEALVGVNPALVYVSLTAYGQDGPIGHRPAYDHVVQAMSGIMETTGTEDTGPVKVGAPYVDYAAGMKGAMATLAALMEQRRTGNPIHVDSAMLDTSLLLMANTLTVTANTGTQPPKLGNQAASGAAASGCFETADGLLAIAANTERQFAELCRCIGHKDLAKDERFSTHRSRQDNAGAFQTILQSTLMERTAEAWEAALDTSGVPASRVRSLDEVLAGGQPQARALLHDMEIADKTVTLPTMGVKFDGVVPSPSEPPPRLGHDTERLLAELGLDTAAVERLRSEGVI